MEYVRVQGGVVRTVNDSCMCVSSGRTGPISHRSHRDPCRSPHLFPILSLSLFRPRRTRTLSPALQREIDYRKEENFGFCRRRPPRPPTTSFHYTPCVCVSVFSLPPLSQSSSLPPLPHPSIFFCLSHFPPPLPVFIFSSVESDLKNTTPRVLHPQIPGCSLRGGY